MITSLTDVPTADLIARDRELAERLSRASSAQQAIIWHAEGEDRRFNAAERAALQALHAMREAGDIERLAITQALTERARIARDAGQPSDPQILAWLRQQQRNDAAPMSYDDALAFASAL